ncbi:MAG: Asp-tRNA(Asn)/Glu-tRNA(Gln) amidotransferase subunit GatA [Leptolyngbya sp. PLA3]|nr:MAG: Asp-tRNA(Asn)/Glu-tRNA(Gln) amidotransferase subunit GatA [Cyanobacteria bacterium CYA]MCE7968934.1 Asp-tRNA(Asn)/Glu-tRNA(Gln) amidotransferase subunit GatA [Leptolyngbya sp. PL-A3]
MPIAVKENICTRQGLSTAGSRILENYRSPFDATAVARLLDAGAVIVGKTNMDEFGMGSSTEHSPQGPTRNPWDVDRVPGGSSGGSAAAVAAGIVPVALGSDTGGSIRQPAALCGLVGLKPTYGRVSRYGLIAYASSLDVVGPIARTVTDAARVLQVIAGPDPHDSTCSSRPVPDMLGSLETPVEHLRVGLVRSMLSCANHPSVNQAVEDSASRLAGAGAAIVDVDLLDPDIAIAAYYIVAPAEASSNLARFDGVRYGRRAALPDGASLEDLYCATRTEGFGPEVRRRIMFGTHVLSSGYYDAYYLRALKARRLIRNDFDRAFDTHALHALLMPVTPGPAFRIGEKDTDPLALYLEDVYTVGVSLAGLPGIALPAGMTAGENPLPIGVQLVGRPFDEPTLLRVARTLERQSPAMNFPA